MDSNSTGSITSSASPLTVIETTSREPPATDFRDEFIATVRVAVLGVALFLTMAGNIVVLVLVLQSKPKSAHLSRIYYFLLHLSIADILAAKSFRSVQRAKAEETTESMRLTYSTISAQHIRVTTCFDVISFVLFNGANAVSLLTANAEKRTSVIRHKPVG
ncbi:oxytocin receptor-like isoform X3 [Varroa jacobsoni]|uniref:G-protein coupled receptors family 1 profile domain-containing protein n=1 Tax=Varroa destructor TaxID=109461 RepID=A0A7M7JAF7_VARDE|nr:oxytocin receptor-like isoform X3 [Varroa destructor]XP_022706789.1 oxytocin receptor-like isoform X3 [Varroa jacobsoni]